jgi:hypothetical protein
MTLAECHKAPAFSRALKSWTANSPKYVPGTLMSVLGYATAFASNMAHSQNGSGEQYFYQNKAQMRKELKKFKQLLRMYFSEQK